MNFKITTFWSFYFNLLNALLFAYCDSQELPKKVEGHNGRISILFETEEFKFSKNAKQNFFVFKEFIQKFCFKKMRLKFSSIEGISLKIVKAKRTKIEDYIGVIEIENYVNIFYNTLKFFLLKNGDFFVVVVDKEGNTLCEKTCIKGRNLSYEREIINFSEKVESPTKPRTEDDFIQHIQDSMPKIEPTMIKAKSWTEVVRGDYVQRIRDSMPMSVKNSF